MFANDVGKHFDTKIFGKVNYTNVPGCIDNAAQCFILEGFDFNDMVLFDVSVNLDAICPNLP